MSARFEMRLSEPEKELWIEQARKDGFMDLAPWIRWLANQRTAIVPASRTEEQKQ